MARPEQTALCALREPACCGLGMCDRATHFEGFRWAEIYGVDLVMRLGRDTARSLDVLASVYE
jgi:hypothetical protein